MKTILLLAAGFFAGTAAFSQTSTTATGSGTKWGLKVGVNLPKFSSHVEDGENPETKTTTNFHVRGYADLPLGSMFSIQPGVALEGKGGKSTLGNTDFETNTLNIEVPVNLVGKVPLGTTGTSLYLGAGPYIAYAVSGEFKTDLEDGPDTKTDIEFGDKAGDDLKPLDLGVNFLGGIQLGGGFNVGAQYGLGLNDLRPTGEGGSGKLTNRVWSFSLGYSF